MLAIGMTSKVARIPSTAASHRSTVRPRSGSRMQSMYHKCCSLMHQGLTTCREQMTHVLRVYPLEVMMGHGVLTTVPLLLGFTTLPATLGVSAVVWGATLVANYDVLYKKAWDSFVSLSGYGAALVSTAQPIYHHVVAPVLPIVLPVVAAAAIAAAVGLPVVSTTAVVGAMAVAGWSVEWLHEQLVQYTGDYTAWICALLIGLLMVVFIGCFITFAH